MDWFCATDLPRYITKDTLPQIVRDLLVASIPHDKLKDFNIPTENLSGTFGVDGEVEVVEGFVHPYIPAGKSKWEMGVDQNTKAKAENDYNKRKHCSDCVFVFVTPQVFTKAEEWIEEKKLEKEYGWRGIRCINRDRLYEWLCSCPGVAVNWAEKWGLKPEDAYSINSVWEEWSAACGEEFSLSLVSALGRSVLEADETANDKLRAFLRLSGPMSFTIESCSTEESRLYFAAVLLQQGDVNFQKAASSVVCVDSAVSFKRLISYENPLVIVTSLQDAALRNMAIKRGHRVCHVLRKGSAAYGADVWLPFRIPTGLFFEALNKGGVSSDRIESLKYKTGRNLSAFRSVVGGEPPTWIKHCYNNALLAALLVGGWSSEFEDDKAVMVRLSGKRSYKEFTQALRPILAQDSPPLQNEPPYWRTISSYFSWPKLAKALSQELLSDFSSVCIEILGKEDVVKELPSEKKHFAQIDGVQNSYSSLLRSSLAESLIQLSILLESDCGIMPVFDGSMYVDDMIATILRNSKGMWKSVSPFVRELAEAAPSAFLDAVEEELESPQTFKELVSEHYSPIYGEMHHVELLWALEIVAWNKKYLQRVVYILLQLEQRWEHLPDNIGNRASSSLSNILSFWNPQTTADVGFRNNLISKIVRDHPQEFWPVLVKMLPKGHMVQSPNVRPKWRWDVDDVSVTIKDAENVASHIYKCCLLLAKGNQERSVELLNSLSVSLTRDDRELFYVQIEKDYRIRKAEWCGCCKIWAALRNILKVHQDYPDASWAFSAEEITRLKDMYYSMAPDGYLDQKIHLFVGYPSLVECPPQVGRYGDSFNEYVKEEQLKVVAELYHQNGEKGLYELIEACAVQREDESGAYPEPYLVGMRIVAFLFSEYSLEKLDLFLIDLIRNKKYDKKITEGAFSAYIEKQKDNILSGAYVRAKNNGYKFFLNFLLQAPVTLDLLTKIDSEDPRVVDGYWRKAFIPPWTGDEAFPFCLKKMLQYKRPLDALNLVRFTEKGDLPFSLLSKTLEDSQPVLASSNGVGASSHTIIEVFKAARACADHDKEQLARLEWAYYPYFEFSSYKAQTLYEGIVTSPEFFIEIVSLAYKSSKVEYEKSKQEVDEQASMRAFDVLKVGAARQGWLIPAFCEGGHSLNNSNLFEWVIQVRRLAFQKGYVKPVDAIIGEQLAYSDVDDTDNAWPELIARKVLDVSDGKDLRKAYMLGHFNRNGSYSGSSVEHYKRLRDSVGRNVDLLTGGYLNVVAMMNQMRERYNDDVRYAIERERIQDMGR